MLILLLFYLAEEKIKVAEVSVTGPCTEWIATLSSAMSISTCKAPVTTVLVNSPSVRTQLTDPYAVYPLTLVSSGIVAPTWITRPFSECPAILFTFSFSAAQSFQTSHSWWNMAVTTSVNVSRGAAP